MKYILSTVAILTLCLLGCSSDSGPFDPTLFKSPYSGITYTDENGDLIGPVDSGDWQLAWGASPGGTPIRKLVPTSMRAFPAYPNPFSNSTVLSFTIAYATEIRLWIKGEAHQLVRSYLVQNEAGMHEFVWDGKNDQGEQVPDGIYRVYYEIGTDDPLSGFGDIWLTHSDQSWMRDN